MDCCTHCRLLSDRNSNLGSQLRWDFNGGLDSICCGIEGILSLQLLCARAHEHSWEIQILE